MCKRRTDRKYIRKIKEDDVCHPLAHQICRSVKAIRRHSTRRTLMTNPMRLIVYVKNRKKSVRKSQIS